MDDTRINIILDNCKGIRRDRALRVELGQLKESDDEFKKYIKNELVRARRIVIAFYNYIESLYELRMMEDKKYKHFESINDPVNRAETYLKISEINNTINDKLKIISDMGNFFIAVLRSNILEEHDLCQIFNINWRTFQDKKHEYIEQFGKEEHLTYKVISVTGVEYRDRKGRDKEFYDCHRSEMPLYWSMFEHIMREIEDNKELNKATDERFKELFPDIKTCRVFEDLEGNIVKIVEEEK